MLSIVRIYEWGFSPLDLRRSEDYAGLLRGKACAGSFFLRQITHEPPSSSGLYARGSLHRASTEGCPLFAIVLGCCPVSFVFTAGRFLSWVGHCLLGGCSVVLGSVPLGFIASSVPVGHLHGDAPADRLVWTCWLYVSPDHGSSG